MDMFKGIVQGIRHICSNLFGCSKEKNGSMKTYDAAVFFVDILGFSALTKGQIKDVTTKDYEAWGVDSTVEHPYSYLSAAILIEFRDALLSLKKQAPALRIAQISDCAFIWSEDVAELLKGVHRLMWTLMKDKGILCRGGLSYGEVVTVGNPNNELGAFIVGDAVSRAAKNEPRLKGPRITMDVEFPQSVWNHSEKAKSLEYISYDLFHEIQSEINMDTVDEYRWYLCDADYITSQTYPPSHKQCVELTKKRLTLANVLKYHPRMGWNSRGAEGQTHLQAGVWALSKNRVLNVLHYYETKIVLDNDKRSLGKVEKMNAKVETDRYFSIQEEDKWKEGLADCD